MRTSALIRRKINYPLTVCHQNRCNRVPVPLVVSRRRTLYPYSSPYLCTNRPSWRGSLRLRPLIYVVCGEVREGDTACQDMQANIDSPRAQYMSQKMTTRGLKERTAAPPAIVPSRQLLISITFLTVWLAIQSPAVARESVATMMPP